ncbi:MAG: DUF2510 domain-containing protein [Actinomycetota bacterium]|nr:DUF2510 domain-containing protein [Actinomycetota bacterium]
MTDGPAGWKPDPTGRHDHRYFDGTRWTEHVSDAGVAATDPYEGPTGETAEPSAPAATPTTSEAAAVTPTAASSTPSGAITPPFGTSSSPEATSSPAVPDTGASAGPSPTSAEPEGAPTSTFRTTEAGIDAPDDGAPGRPAEPPAAGSSWTSPTVVNEPTEPVAPSGGDEPTSTFRMTEDDTLLDVPAAGPERTMWEAPATDDPTLADVLAQPDDTAVFAGSPPPPTVTPPSTDDGGSKRRLLIGAGILVVVAIVAGFLLLGGDDDDEGDGTLEERIAEEIRAGGQSGLSEDEAECLAGELIDEIGSDRLGDVDFSAGEPPAEIADELNDAFVQAIPTCDIQLGAIDGGDDSPLGGDGGDDGGDGADGPTTDATLSGDQLAQFRTLLTEQYRNNLGLSEEKASCLANTMADAIEQGELDESQSFDAFFKYLDACGISVSELGGATGAG